METGPPFYVVIRATRRPSRLKDKGSTFISQLFKTLSIGPAVRIEPMTSRSAVKRSTDWAKPAAVYNPIHLLYIHFSTLFMLHLLYFVVTSLPKG